MNRFAAILKPSAPYIRFSLLPILLAVYPVLFHYGNNINIALSSDLEKLLALFAGIGIALYGLFCLAGRGRAVQAANAACVFLLFFHTYGLAFDGLRALDVTRVGHSILFPLFVLLGLQLAGLISRLNTSLSTRIWQRAVIVLGVLVVFNLFRIVSAEIRRGPAKIAQPNAAPALIAAANKNYPDIYYFVFDEMAGFDAMRQYWHYTGVDSFEAFLKSDGFYVAEQSRGAGIDTLYELASRLNYQDYPHNPNDIDTYGRGYLAVIADNKVVQYLKTLGYTTVGFEELRSHYDYSVAPPMKVDHLYEQPSGAVLADNIKSIDDFMLMVEGETMLQPFVANVELNYPIVEAQKHKDMVLFTMDKVSHLNDILGPKFVYVHLLIPHTPFMFNADGSLVSPPDYLDWNNYLGNYIFALSLAENSVKDLLATADPEHPPVIIIQSDHGARNLPYEPSKTLQNYPDDLQTLIVDALYLPGCDTSVLTQDMNPINTFPIVFNCYFDAGIPLK